MDDVLVAGYMKRRIDKLPLCLSVGSLGTFYVIIKPWKTRSLSE